MGQVAVQAFLRKQSFRASLCIGTLLSLEVVAEIPGPELCPFHEFC